MVAFSPAGQKSLAGDSSSVTSSRFWLFFKGVLFGHESRLILLACCLVGHGRASESSHGPAETVPSLPLGHLGWICLASPSSALSCRGSGPGPIWPAALLPLSLGNQGSLCIHTLSNYSPLAAAGWKTHAEGTLPRSVCSQLDIQQPRIAVP